MSYMFDAVFYTDGTFSINAYPNTKKISLSKFSKKIVKVEGSYVEKGGEAFSKVYNEVLRSLRKKVITFCC